MKSRITCCLLAISFFQFVGSFHSSAQGTAFTYQGRLSSGTTSMTGLYDFRFAAYDAASSGSQIGSTVNATAVGVTNGLFTVTLDFGVNVFTGAARFLDLAAKTNGSAAAFVSMTPRQPLTPAPYAILAGSLNGPLPAGNFSGLYANSVTLSNAANSFFGNYGGNGSGLSNLNVSAIGPAGLFKLVPKNLALGNPTVYPLSAVPSSAVATDVNGDGWVDLIISANATIQVMTNNRAGTFGLARTVNTVSTVDGIAVLNSNGDLALATGVGALFLGNDGHGNYSINNLINYTTNSFPGLASVTALQGFAFFGDKDGHIVSFSGNVPTAIPVAAAMSSVATVALMINGSPFVAATSFSEDKIKLVSSGTITASYSTGTGAGPARIIAADINGDGRSDVIVGNYNTSTLSIFTNNGVNGLGAFATLSTISKPFSLATADLNGDGFIDIVCGTADQDSSLIFTNNANHGFDVWQTFGSGLTGASVTAADINSDGLTDLIAGFYDVFSNSSSLQVMKFIPQTLFLSGAVQMTNSGNNFSGNFTGFFSGDGSGLSGLNASQISSGTLSLAQLPSVVQTNGGSLKVGPIGTVFTNLQAGQVAMNIVVSTSRTNFTFNFPQAFTSVPKIIVSPSNDPGFPNVDDTFSVTVRNVSTTGCTVNVVRTDANTGWSQNLRINWQAWQ